MGAHLSEPPGTLCIHNSEFSVSLNEASNVCNLHDINFKNYNHVNPPKGCLVDYISIPNLCGLDK